MAREVSLSGGDISVIKTLGFGGQSMKGSLLMERLGDMDFRELASTLEGLMMFDYILGTIERIRTPEDIAKADFRVNQALARDLKDAINPRADAQPERRRRRG